MSAKSPRTLLLTFGCAAALSSCSVFKKDEPQAANDAYAAANPYATGTGTAAPAASGNAYGAPGAYDAGGTSGPGYTTPNYNQPYVQPSTPPTGPGYGSAYDTPPPAHSGTAGSGRTHKVVAKDTLSGISKRYGVSMEAIARANNIKNPNSIPLGKTLIIP